MYTFRCFIYCFAAGFAFYSCESPANLDLKINQINQIENWESVKTIPLHSSTEGGEATYYFKDQTLKKISVNHYGEMGKKERNYYLDEAKLIAVIEKQYQYNRPITWDSTAMIENGDTEVFDPTKSKIEEKRSYFYNKKLSVECENNDCLTFTDSKVVKEHEAYILKEFESLREMLEK